jgi:simple sugar transport system substrate-binding protein
VLVGCGKTDEPAGPDSASNAPQKTPVKVGFSQVGDESAWRTANTQSIQSEAKARGIDLKFSDAQEKPENQIMAIRNFISQGVDVIAFSPKIETGWEPVLREAKDAGIPVIVSDRRPDVPDDLYVTFIGSDFVEEGRRAAEWIAKFRDGKAVIAELTGTPGSAPANDRKKGFEEVLAKYPGMKIVYSQTGDFKRALGKQTMEALLKSPVGKKINTVFAHNDDMAIGAIQAMEEAGLKPGKDITVVSIDGIHDALQAIVDGKLNCSVECNPLLGPFLFDAVDSVLAKKELPKRTVVEDKLFDSSNAAAALPDRKY